MKKGKEIKLNTSDNYTLSFGTVDNKNPKAIYIEISAWGEPKHEGDINYTRVIGNLHKQVKQTIYDNINTSLFLRDRTIVDLDMRVSGINYNKRSFMNCEITLFQVKPKAVNTEEVRVIVSDIIDNVVGSALEVNKYFNFYKTKSQKQLTAN